MKITKTTPIYVYDDIVPAAQFWERSFGFQRIVEVPHEGLPGFILLTNGVREIMFQSVASLRADVPAVAEFVRHGGVFLYCDVDSIAKAQEKIPAKDILVGPRTTFYGAKEIFFRDVTGAVVGFAEMTEKN